MGRLLVVGSMNMDMTIFTDRMPKAGETISGSEFLLSPGGKGANQAVAAAKMGADTRMYGCVGEDVFGRELICSLSKQGVDAASVERLPSISTGVASITVCEGDNRIVLYDGANGKVELTRALMHLLSECDALMMQMEIPLQTVLQLIDLAHEKRKTVFLTPAPAQELPMDVYPKIDYLLPNEIETSLLLGRELATDGEILWALRRFREMGVRQPVITLGERGVGCYLDGEPQIRPGFRVQPVDTTAAGDTFTGALASCILSGMPLREAVDFSQLAASICVTRPGAQNSIPTRDEVLNSVRQLA